MSLQINNCKPFHLTCNGVWTCFGIIMKCVEAFVFPNDKSITSYHAVCEFRYFGLLRVELRLYFDKMMYRQQMLSETENRLPFT